MIEECESCRGTGIELATHNSVSPQNVPLCKACKGKGEFEIVKGEENE